MASSPQSSKFFPSQESSEDCKERQLYPRTYKIHDSQQMVWVLTGNSLTAVPARNNVKPVSLSLIACRDTEFQDTEKGNLVILGIESQSLCLFCAENGGTPTLQLKNVDIMEMYSDNKVQKAFLFYHSKEGSTSAFQSVSYPGWFIATSSTARQAIILTQQRGEAHNTNFYLEPED
ncbi:interleukin-36 beta isoform X2 [Cricetulus griseus]|uniref:Interleukin-1 n=1 Tax=Cricetulus griseus TaxID=10029 RepID=A0A9J7G7R8_CRIGR|nr:interleukin-36 beta isoform X2 [Cricetulus griseus]ERE70642.1 interleukin-36 beta-like protein [Cricetulus griseus]